MNEKGKKNLFIIIFCIAGLLTAGSLCFGAYHRNKHVNLRDTLDAANAGELQRQLGLVTDELERARAEIIESQQSVERLEDIDQRRLAGIERIERSAESIGVGIINAKSGNERAEIAIRGIAEIIDILEDEFGRGAVGD